MPFFDLADVQPLTGDELMAEIETLQDKPPVVKIAGIDCYPLSDAAARTIAQEYGDDWEHLERMGQGLPVDPGFVNDDIDDAVEHLTGDRSMEGSLRLLKFLRGWMLLRVYNMPNDGFQPVPERYQLKIESISVRDLIGRNIANRKGVVFRIADVRYRLELGQMTIEIAEIDDEGHVVPYDVQGIFNLEGWTLL